ncbi:efflux RND transporter permease subunit [Peribacillus sp. Hz7]|uniref:efflux RND transporter permease subunit n=1 Tax=Peribacillus sp. Hz7 TaxID=3344873 RepID=UPI0035CC2B64
MKKLVETTMQRAILMMVCVVIIWAWGGISAFQMQRDYLPGINNTTLSVSMRVPGYQAAQVKQQVTDNLASAVKTVDGLTNVETTSYDGGLFMSGCIKKQLQKTPTLFRCFLYFSLNYHKKEFIPKHKSHPISGFSHYETAF